jgi:hypothetical protein
MTTGSSDDIGFLVAENSICSNYASARYCGKSQPYSIYVDNNKSLSLGAIVTTNKLVLCNASPTPSLTPTVTPTITPSISVSPGPQFNGTVTYHWLKALPLGCSSGTSIVVTGNGTTFCSSTQFYSTTFSGLSSGQRYALQYSGYALEITTNGTNFASVTSGCILCGSPSVTPTSTPTPTPSISIGAIPTITSINTAVFNCSYPNDYIGYGLQLDIPTPVDVYYTLQFEIYDATTYSFVYYAYPTGVISAGSSIDNTNANPCTGGGFYLGSDYYINNVCISSVDNTVTNPLGTC